MKRILMAILVAGGIAVATPFLPVQVQQAEARPDCQAVDQNGDGYIDFSDIVAVKTQPGGEGKIHILLNNFGEAC